MPHTSSASRVLLGAILPLDLRLLGFFRTYPVEVLAPFLVRCAAVGLSLALLTGAWLFSVKPDEYLANPAFRWKLALLALALINVGFQHSGHAWQPSPVASGARAGRGIAVPVGMRARCGKMDRVCLKWIESPPRDSRGGK